MNSFKLTVLNKEISNAINNAKQQEARIPCRRDDERYVSVINVFMMIWFKFLEQNYSKSKRRRNGNVNPNRSLKALITKGSRRKQKRIPKFAFFANRFAIFTINY